MYYDLAKIAPLSEIYSRENPNQVLAQCLKEEDKNRTVRIQ